MILPKLAFSSFTASKTGNPFIDIGEIFFGIYNLLKPFIFIFINFIPKSC
jgi:hypothetical protein